MAIDCSTLKETQEQMKKLLGRLIPDFEIQLKSELVFEINKLKKEKNALILGHNYMEPALFHSVPDITGDSLKLAREAALTDKSPIIFCGVRFMAETAKIMNPDKTVLLPAKIAGCSLASGITAEDVRRLKAHFPGTPVVSYINTYADVKAEVDVVCTSGNYIKIANSLNSEAIIFLPDEFMAKNLARETGRRFIAANASNLETLSNKAEDLQNCIIGWTARCEVHEQFTVEDISNVRKQFPDVMVISHPECSPEVVAASDASGSTSGMVDVVKNSSAPSFMLLTECSMADNIMAENPHKEMVRMCSIRCPHMNEITLQDTLDSLRYNQYQIEVEEQIRLKAKRSVERMLALS
jgi:quinolinate synthase